MEMTDKIEDIEELENFFGTDSIELMIRGLVQHLEYIEMMRKHKFWEMKTTSEFDMMKDAVSKQSAKFPIYKKGERPVAKLIEWNKLSICLFFYHFYDGYDEIVGEINLSS